MVFTMGNEEAFLWFFVGIDVDLLGSMTSHDLKAWTVRISGCLSGS